MTWLEKTRRWVHKRITAPAWRAPWAGTVTTLLIIFAGCLGSIYSQAIQATLPLGWFRNANIGATLFWISAAVACLGYFLREKALSAEQLRLQHRMESLIRTTPSPDFLSEYATLYQLASEVVFPILEGSAQSEENLERTIRYLLRTMAILARRFHNFVDDVNFAASVMIAWSPDKMPQDAPTCALFCDKATDFTKLRAILMWDPKLATTADDEDAAPDSSLQRFCLCVPHEALKDDRYQVLPGAPFALATGEAQAFSDTSKIGLWCEDHGDFAPGRVAELTSYFKKSSVKGFFSIPLLAEGSDGAIIAVLNIHCNRRGVLGSEEVLQHYYHVVLPFQVLLVKLLNQLYPR